MADTGAQTADSITSDNSNSGAWPWVNPSNATSSDNSYAIVNTDALATTEYIKALDFDFVIPAGATIDGIKVEIERGDDWDDEVRDVEVKLVVGGSITGDNKANANGWTTTDTWITYGGATDKWGATLTQANVTAADFGVVLSCEVYSGGGYNVPRIDQIKTTAYYTESSGAAAQETKQAILI